MDPFPHSMLEYVTEIQVLYTRPSLTPYAILIIMIIIIGGAIGRKLHISNNINNRNSNSSDKNSSNNSR